MLKVSPIEYCYIYYINITRTDVEHHFSQLYRVRFVLSRWTFYRKCFFCWGTKKMLYIQNWWTIPLRRIEKESILRESTKKQIQQILTTQYTRFLCYANMLLIAEKLHGQIWIFACFCDMLNIYLIFVTEICDIWCITHSTIV